MKMVVVGLALGLVSLGAQATCTSTDFAIQDVHAGMMNGRVVVAGKLLNNCAMPAGAQLEVQAKDSSGNVVASRKGWPAGDGNIQTGQSVSFDLGRLIHPQADMQTYTVSIVEVKSW